VSLFFVDHLALATDLVRVESVITKITALLPFNSAVDMKCLAATQVSLFVEGLAAAQGGIFSD